MIERKIGRQIRLFEQKRDGIGKKIDERSAVRAKRGIRLDDEVRFIRSWIERPLSIGAVTPSGKMLARTMARYVDLEFHGPGGRARARHRAGHRGAGRSRRRSGAAGAGRIQSELLPHAARSAIRTPRWCRATPTACASLLESADAPAAAVVSGLPLVTKPMQTRLRLIARRLRPDAAPGAPFVQFTYSVAPPMPKLLGGFSAEASERIWMNIPPARVWVYRKA